MARGVLVGLARSPVKSLGGEALGAARLDSRGVGGDRAHALLDLREGREGRWLTVRQVPRLLAWSAAYPDAPDDRLDPDDLSRWPELLRWLHRRRGSLFGINARVVAGGLVRVGDPVTVAEPALQVEPRPATDWDVAPRGGLGGSSPAPQREGGDSM